MMVGTLQATLTYNHTFYLGDSYIAILRSMVNHVLSYLPAMHFSCLLSPCATCSRFLASDVSSGVCSVAFFNPRPMEPSLPVDRFAYIEALDLGEAHKLLLRPRTPTLSTTSA